MKKYYTFKGQNIVRMSYLVYFRLSATAVAKAIEYKGWSKRNTSNKESDLVFPITICFLVSYACIFFTLTEALQGLNRSVLLYKDIWLYPCWVCKSHRVKFRPWYGTISWGDQPTTRYQFDCFGLLPARNGKWLCPQWNWNLFWMLDLLSCFQCLSAPISENFWSDLFIINILHTILLLI